VVCLDAPGLSYQGRDPFIIHTLGPAKTPWQYSNLLLPWLVENLKRFDVVIAHGLWLYPTYAVAKALNSIRKNKTQVPGFFVMPHGMLDPYFQKAGSRKLKAVRNVVYWKFIESKVINNADGVLFTCQAELELARNTFTPYHPKAELNVSYGIPAPPDFLSAHTQAFLERCPSVKGRNYLLFLSRIHPKKGVDILLEAYLQFIQQNPEEIPALVIAGPGTDTAFGRSLAQLVGSNELLSKNVFFAGMLTGDAKWGAFYNCDAFVLPSHQENFGIAVVEALACSKPVLISNQVNIWKEIENANAGIVYEDKAVHARDGINKFYALSQSEKSKMSINAVTCYRINFSIQEAAIKLLKQVS
jgi:glycosyltransferase involved in cell wall biosynthesis